MPGKKQLWSDTQGRQGTEAGESQVQTLRKRVSGDSVQTCRVPGSPSSTYHLQTALHLHMEKC